MRRRKSAQREKIYGIIKSRPDHPTAVQIYDALRKESPSAGMGNVYRNIRILMEEGRIKRRDFNDGVEHFDAVTSLHYHFVCETCGAITDFPLPVQSELEAAARKLSGRTITGHTIQFFGVCESCAGKKKGP